MNLTDETLAARELRDAVATRDPHTIARVLMSNIWPLYSARYEQLTAAIEALPQSVLERYPVLRVAHRMTPVLARTTRPFKPLVYPEHSRSMSADELDILTLAQMIAFRFSGDVAAAMIYARRLQDRIPETTRRHATDRDGPLWYFHHQIGTTLLASGDSTGALEQLADARKWGSLSSQPDALRMAIGREALAHAVRGSLEKAELALAQISDLPAATAAHLNSISLTERTARALISAERMGADLGDRLAQLEPYDSVEVTWPFALLARTRAFLAWQRPAEALEAVRLARDAHPDQHGSFASDVINSTSIDALTAGGDTLAARRAAESSTNGGILTRLAIARHHLHCSQFDRAREDLRRLEHDATLDPAQQMELTLMSAWLQGASGGGLSHRTVQEIAEDVRAGNSRRVLASMPQQAVEHLRHALPHEIQASLERSSPVGHGVEITSVPSLTPGELRVLSALPSQTTIAQIAAAFHVSPNTIKTQLRTLYRKLGCSTRSEAVRTAVRLRLISIESE